MHPKCKENMSFSQLQLLEFIEIETSIQCNRKCSWCPTGNILDRTKQSLMDWNLFEKIISNLKDLDYIGKLALHNYNEPLLNPRLYEEIDLINKELPNVEIQLFTNGDLLNLEVLNKLISKNVGHVRITLYRKSQASRGEIIKFIKLKKLEQIEWSILEADQGMIARSRIKETNIKIISPNIDGFYNSRGGSLKQLIPYKRTLPCHMSTFSAAIDSQGVYKMCCNIIPEYEGHREYLIGNLAHQRLETIWQNEKLLAMRKRQANADWSLSSVCETCKQASPLGKNTWQPQNALRTDHKD